MQPMQISNRGLAYWCERAVIGCIFLIAVCAPHSIAATQTSWLLGLLFWLLRFVIYPRPALFRTPVDYLLLGFFVLSGVSGVFSYTPIMSIGKMRAASLFTIVYLVVQNVRTVQLAHVLALTLIGSCMVNVFLTAGQLVVGRGVKVEGVKAESPLAQAVFRTRTVTQPTAIRSGDIVWEVDGKPIGTPDELVSALAGGYSIAPSGGAPVAKVKIYRVEWMPE
ncbi:MAG TPA: hypothetical protein VK893_06990, partial [Pyrinomonadaceae bacterium]|nr:hypothetical protein [Pyrinomonadaceae bacterium]